MSYNKIDEEFTDLVEMIFESDLRVEIIFDALRIINENAHVDPKLALEIEIEGWISKKYFVYLYYKI